MRLLKPQPSTPIDRAHPLAQGLSMAWLLNEGAGAKVRDGVRLQTATADEVPTWHADRCDFNGTDQFFKGPVTFDGDGPWSVLMKVSLESLPSERTAFGFSHSDVGSRLAFGYYLNGGHAYFRALLREDDNTNVINAITGDPLSYGAPHWLGLAFDPDAGHYYCYTDGQLIHDANTSSFTSITFNQVTIGCACYYTTTSVYWPGSVYSVYVYHRVLTPGDVSRLYRRPYAFFKRPVAPIPAWTASPVYDLVGSIGAATTAGATARVTRGLAGTCAASTEAGATLSQAQVISLSASIQAGSALSGTVNVSSAPPERQTPWLSDALFGGMTARAFKLGTVLTRGWFWTRRRGCSVLYRGPTLDAVDFGDILCVVNRDAEEVSLPTYLSHEPGSTWCYVLRRFNTCGHSERTTAAALLVTTGPDGTLAAPAPNGVLGLTARRVDGDRVALRWYYSPLGQPVAPEVFTVYADDETMLGAISYQGRRVYHFQTDPLASGPHTFAVRARSAAGIESVTKAKVSCAIGGPQPPAATILTAEAIS